MCAFGWRCFLNRRSTLSTASCAVQDVAGGVMSYGINQRDVAPRGCSGMVCRCGPAAPTASYCCETITGGQQRLPFQPSSRGKNRDGQGAVVRPFAEAGVWPRSTQRLATYRRMPIFESRADIRSGSLYVRF